MKDWVIAVDLGGTKIGGGLLGTDGTLLAQRQIPTEASAGAGEILSRIQDLVSYLRSSAPGSVLGVGVATPGVIHQGRVLFATPNLPGWTGMDLAGELSAAIGLKVWVENDGHAAAWGEYMAGAGQGAETMALITIGTGIGGGIVAGGSLVRGAIGLAGRLGHVSVAAGPRCYCGNRGCVELLASGRAIERQANARLRKGAQSSLKPGPDLTARDVADAAHAGDALAREVLARAGEALGKAMVQIIQMLNPHAIVVAGGLMAAGPELLGPAEEMVRRHARPEATSGLQILPARLGADAGLYGIGELARLHLVGSHHAS